ncbi:uncharacterized protein ATNIH1004_009389 [Aspergillus tanneri]|uniref:Uncharacterized protein n=1 Tax=Aspergillus tanneri TaxID=1220188 RepID=A0A5M9MDW9_9EURO|nr:uncharacterized protein ATNIH1004_009389 [Aspergillus tanneri]KAA8645172.1 hypothetical protein ATNIH1004_009389 [Aspergillus tanneri]
MTTRIPTRTYFCDVERPGRPRKPARLDEKAEVGDYYDHVFRWLGDIDERGILVPSLEEIYIEASSETTNKLLSIFVLAFAFGPMDLTPLSRCTDAELCGLLPRPGFDAGGTDFIGSWDQPSECVNQMEASLDVCSSWSMAGGHRERFSHEGHQVLVGEGPHCRATEVEPAQDGVEIRLDRAVLFGLESRHIAERVVVAQPDYLEKHTAKREDIGRSTAGLIHGYLRDKVFQSPSFAILGNYLGGLREVR